jgi:hypothetical protein
LLLQVLFNAEDFYYYALATLAVEFCVEDALPGAGGGKLLSPSMSRDMELEY